MHRPVMPAGMGELATADGGMATRQGTDRRSIEGKRMFLEKFKLDGKTALVTGDGRGSGLACSQALAETGADVVIAEIDASDATSLMTGSIVVADGDCTCW